jgi:hypothetical protein
MVRIVPFNKEDPEGWKQQNEEVLEKIHDESAKMIIRGVLNMHELEHTGEWKQSRRRLDYSKLPFETYLQHHTTWSREDYVLLQEVVFEHLDELNRNGLGDVLKRLKKEKKWQGKNPRKRSNKPLS